jgi:sulfoxide reductase heme-binding subunit YedZ
MTARTHAPFAALAPWTDRAGRISWLKLAVFLACCAPAVWIAWRWQAGALSPKPVTDALRETGDWALRFLVAALAVTPLRHAARWNRIYLVRRMLGLAALAYALAHIGFWFAQEDFVWRTILMESILRVYLLVGWLATFGMIALGATSNEAAIRRLGSARWNNLHGWIYAIALASLVHYFMLIRLDATQAALMAGLCALFAGFRALRKRAGDFGALSLFALALVAGLATALIEAGYYAFATGADGARVLAANLDFSFTVRPAWWVLAAGLFMAFARLARDLFRPSPFPRS